MKISKRKKLLLGLAASTLFGIGGCTPKSNEVETVSGPPQAFQKDGPDVTENELPDVYGPPVEDIEPTETLEKEEPAPTEIPEKEAEPTEAEATEKEIPSPTEDQPSEKPQITPEDNELPDVYGPPVDSNIVEPVYGPPQEDSIAPDMNMQPVVYGPPEWFENQGNKTE